MTEEYIAVRSNFLYHYNSNKNTMTRQSDVNYYILMKHIIFYVTLLNLNVQMGSCMLHMCFRKLATKIISLFTNFLKQKLKTC